MTRGRLTCLAIVIVACVAITVVGAYFFTQERNKFNEDFDAALAAYEAGECKSAAEFQELRDSTFFESEPSAQELSDFEVAAQSCEDYQNGVNSQNQGTYAIALGFYRSALSSPEVPAAFTTVVGGQIASLVQQAEAEQLVNEVNCFETVSEQVATTANGESISQPVVNRAGYDELARRNLIAEEYVPGLTHACGQFAMGQQNYEQASRLFTDFLQSYPEHELAGEAESGLANATVELANAANAPQISQPEAIPGSTVGVATISIQNASPEGIRMTFVGTETRIEQLDACENCTTYSGDGPEECPSEGTSATYTLQPGEYQVVVESIGEFVTPYRGTWDLQGGFEYPQCFFIVTQ